MWGWCRNDVRLHNIRSFSYLPRVPIKIPRFLQWVTRGTKEQNHSIGFICQLILNRLIWINNTEQEIYTLYDNFFGSVNIWHQLYPETVLPCSTTMKNNPKHALIVMPPPTIIWPITHSTVFWLWNWSNWIPWNLCCWKCKTHRLAVLVNPWQYMVLYCPHSG